MATLDAFVQMLTQHQQEVIKICKDRDYYRDWQKRHATSYDELDRYFKDTATKYESTLASMTGENARLKADLKTQTDKLAAMVAQCEQLENKRADNRVLAECQNAKRENNELREENKHLKDRLAKFIALSEELKKPAAETCEFCDAHATASMVARCGCKVPVCDNSIRVNAGAYNFCKKCHAAGKKF